MPFDNVYGSSHPSPFVNPNLFYDEKSHPFYSPIQNYAENPPCRPCYYEISDCRSVHELKSQYHSIFNFEFFNSMQSQCLDTVLNTDENLVLCAPTGSGKTVMLELSILKLLENFNLLNFKVLYIAPTKALCSEKVKDWQKKFKRLHLNCNFLIKHHSPLYKVWNLLETLKKVKWIYIKMRILCSACFMHFSKAVLLERDNHSLMQNIKLILIDEVHILNEKRGSCLEVIVSRMKAFQNRNQHRICRYIATSATIPNWRDIAKWIGFPAGEATGLIFGEDYRPVPLKKFVLGFPCNDKNQFKFDYSLNFKLKDTIALYSNNKPSLVFCSTRKSVMQAAEFLVRDFSKTKWVVENSFKEKKLNELLPFGVAYHHAGLVFEDRQKIEQMFISGKILVLFSTSTLAVGVNLPAHLVIIKSTVQYCNGHYEEYSELDILQMMGRAGRPQFDTEGVVVIMTDSKNVQRYEHLCQGQQMIESCLHENLIENINAEIVLGTIINTSSALEWLKSTFFYIRVQSNPLLYMNHPNLSLKEIEGNLECLLMQNIQKLTDCGQVILNKLENFEATEMGKCMAKYYVRFETMKKISHVPSICSLSDMLKVISSAEEFHEIRFQSGEKAILNDLNKDSRIKFSIQGKAKETWHKIYLLIQSSLGDISITDFKGGHFMIQELQWILSQASRIHRCLLSVVSTRLSAESLINAIQLITSLKAQFWFDSDNFFRQITGIGKSYNAALQRSSIHSLKSLSEVDARRFEMIVGRNPPFGNQIKKIVLGLSFFFIRATQSNHVLIDDNHHHHHETEVFITIGLTNPEQAIYYGRFGSLFIHFLVAAFDKIENSSRVLEYTRMPLYRLKQPRDIKLVLPNLNHADIEIRASLFSEDFIGLDVHETVKLDICETTKPTTTEMSTVRQSALINDDENPAFEDIQDYFSFDHDDKELGLATPLTKSSSTAIEGDPHLATNVHASSNTENSAVSSVSIDPCKENLMNFDSQSCKHKCRDRLKCLHACCKNGVKRRRIPLVIEPNSGFKLKKKLQFIPFGVPPYNSHDHHKDSQAHKHPLVSFDSVTHKAGSSLNEHTPTVKSGSVFDEATHSSMSEVSSHEQKMNAVPVSMCPSYPILATDGDIKRSFELTCSTKFSNGEKSDPLVESFNYDDDDDNDNDESLKNREIEGFKTTTSKLDVSYLATSNELQEEEGTSPNDDIAWYNIKMFFKAFDL